jgi:large subunit ribosomal protein L25
MTRTELTATIRKEAGKGPARRLRAKEQIPAVLYGRGEVPLSIAIDPAALKAAIDTPTRLNTIITLKLDNGSERTVLLKDYQTDIIHHDLMHADFLDVRLDEKVKVKIPLIYKGIPVGVTDGGILQTMRRELEVECLPKDIPEKVEVDVEALKVGGSLHVKDVKFPKGVTPKYATNFAIAAVVAPEKEEVVAAPVAELVPGAVPGVPGAPGAVPGAPGAPGAVPGAPGAPAAAGARGAPGAAPRGAPGAPVAAPAPAAAAPAAPAKGRGPKK